MPKVSVIVPIYGVEKYLKEALDSIINQTLDDLEIILIDDGGKDSCPQIIDEYAAKDSRIITIHKQNGGYGQSCNVGLEKATGEYIAIMEPDDYIDSHMYEDLYNIAKKYDSDIVKSPFYKNIDTPMYKNVIYEHFTKYYSIPEDRSFTIFEAPHLLYYHPSIWSAIYKREFLANNNIKFKEVPGAGWTDNPFQVQTMCLAKKINYTSKAYYYWRVLNNNPSEELKDYRIPFERCSEIREWMKSNGFFVPELMSAYYLREICYIYTVLGMRNVNDEDDLKNRIYSMVNNMEKDIIINSKYLNNKDKKLYLKILKSKDSIDLLKKQIFIKQLLKKIKKNLIRLRISKKNIKLEILNKTIIDMKNM